MFDIRWIRCWDGEGIESRWTGTGPSETNLRGTERPIESEEETLTEDGEEDACEECGRWERWWCGEEDDVGEDDAKVDDVDDVGDVAVLVNDGSLFIG